MRSRTDVAARTALVTLLAVAGWATVAVYGQDFQGYYAAGRLALDGGNPYDYRQLAPVLATVTGNAGNYPFYYPPWLVILFFPLAVLPYPAARVVWTALGLAGFLVAWRLTLALLGSRLGGWRSDLLAGFVFVVLGWICLRFEQFGFFIWLALVVAALGARAWIEPAHRRTASPSVHPFAVATALVWALAKPQVTALPVVMVLASWAAVRRSALAWFGLALAVWLAVPTIVVPYWWQPFFRPGFADSLWAVREGPDAIVARRINTVLLDWLFGLGVDRPAAFAVYAGVAVLAACWLFRWRKAPLTSRFLAACVVSLLVTPYALQYDYVILAPVAAWVVLRLPVVGWARRAVAVAALALAASVLFWERPISDGYWIALALAAAMLAIGREQHGAQGQVVDNG